MLQFARKADISDSLIRKYLRGSLPGLANLIALADAAGVRAGWLATGEPPKRSGEDCADDESPEERYKRKLSGPLDERLLQEIIEMTRECEAEHGLQLSAKAQASVIGVLYKTCFVNKTQPDRRTAMGMVEVAKDIK